MCQLLGGRVIDLRIDRGLPAVTAPDVIQAAIAAKSAGAAYPRDIIAAQSLFSVYVHPRKGFAYAPTSMFSGYELPEDERVAVSWGQWTVVSAHPLSLSKDGMLTCIPLGLFVCTHIIAHILNGDKTGPGEGRSNTFICCVIYSWHERPIDINEVLCV